MSTIDPRAVIESGAVIGRGCRVGAYSYIGSHVHLGKNNTIASYVIITGNTIIGDNNQIASYAVLGSEPQDIAPCSMKTELRIGNNNRIDGHTLTNVGTDNGSKATIVGNSNHIMDRSHIGHDVRMGNHCILGTSAALGGHVEIENHVTLEPEVAVHQFVRIGDYATLEKGSAVSQDIPPYCIAKGNRAKVVGFSQYGQEIDKNIRHDQINKFTMESKRGIPFRRRESAQ